MSSIVKRDVVITGLSIHHTLLEIKLNKFSFEIAHLGLHSFPNVPNYRYSIHDREFRNKYVKLGR